MGSRYNAICLDCGDYFSIDEGGGMGFHLLKCDACGKDKELSFEKLGELHYGYLKGLKGPYSIPTKSSDDCVQNNYKGEAISEEEYYSKIEKKIRKCRCGGRFKFDAISRCPECRSSNIKKEDEPIMFYD